MRPCPFCGSLNTKIETGTIANAAYSPTIWYSAVACCDCQAKGPPIHADKPSEEIELRAMEAWGDSPNAVAVIRNLQQILAR